MDESREPTGWPLEQVFDPYALEVHYAINADLFGDASTADSSLEPRPLPVYVTRPHDESLAHVVAAAVGGASRIAVLVGGSSTGKTRACWEALSALRDAGGWRLWHPIAPARADAALAGLAGVGPHTVVWLNEAQFYLADSLQGERVAAELRELLRDSARGPVLVLATLWPEHWSTLTAPRDGDFPDSHAQSRELLTGHKIKVPDAFTIKDLTVLSELSAADARLAEAAARAVDGHVTQYLAGAPVLLDRYEEAPAATRALIDAAIDARRLGAGPHIPLAWLQQAAPGYMTDAQWDATESDWLEQALAYTTRAAHGIPGILTAVKTDTRPNRRLRQADHSDVPNVRSPAGMSYRLADYLEQHGRHSRVEQIPPVAFWTAAAFHARPQDLRLLGDAAQARNLYRDAAQLRKNATAYGDAAAAAALVTLLHELHPCDLRPAQWGITYASLNDPYSVASLLDSLRGIGAAEQMRALLARNPAAHTSLDNAEAVASLLNSLSRGHAYEQIEALATRAAAHVPLSDPGALASLLDSLRRIGAAEQMRALLARNPATHASLGSPRAIARLVDSLAGAWEESAGPAMEQIAEQVILLADRAADGVSLEEPREVAELLDGLCAIGSDEAGTVLAGRAAVNAPLGDPEGVAWLLSSMQAAGCVEQVAALLGRDPVAHAVPRDRELMAWLLENVRELFAQQDAAHTPADLREEVDLLVIRLRLRKSELGENEPVSSAQDSGYSSPSKTADSDWLLQEFRKVGIGEHFDVVGKSLPNGSIVMDFIEFSGGGEEVRFGCEPDGNAADPWGWEDLD